MQQQQCHGRHYALRGLYQSTVRWCDCWSECWCATGLHDLTTSSVKLAAQLSQHDEGGLVHKPTVGGDTAKPTRCYAATGRVSKKQTRHRAVWK